MNARAAIYPRWTQGGTSAVTWGNFFRHHGADNGSIRSKPELPHKNLQLSIARTTWNEQVENSRKGREEGTARFERYHPGEGG